MEEREREEEREVLVAKSNDFGIQVEDGDEHEKEEDVDMFPEGRAERVGSFATVINIVKDGLAIGCLALPYGVSEAGVIGTITCLIILTWMNYCGASYLVLSSKIVRKETYARSCSLWTAVGLEAFGVVGEWVVIVALGITLVGAIAALLILVGETMAAMVPALGGRLWTLVAAFPTILLSLPDNLNVFAFTSVGGIMSVLGAYGYIFYFGYTNEEVGVSDPEDWYFKLTLPIFVGIAAFSNSVVIVSGPMYQVMEKKSDINIVLFTSNAILNCIYFFMGYIGFILFDNDSSGIPSNILLILPPSSWGSYLVQSLFVFIVILSLPVPTYLLSDMLNYTLLHTLRSSSFFDESRASPLSLRFKEAVLSHSRLTKSAIITLSVICATLIAVAVPSFGNVIGILGCVTISLISYVLPSIYHLRLLSLFPTVAPPLSLPSRLSHYAVAALGIIVMIAGTATSIMQVL
mmetsp:Transcript_36346/g.102404  ORF Transcript_36346/g.102404 Transcript_36346/m.102404 type:complete len:463 (+) Transcript_36346:53-1441(+)